MNKREMIVDLTPLLDVILIILFLVLVNHQKQNVQQVEVLKDEVVQLEKLQQPKTESEKAWYGSYKDDIGKINVIYTQDMGDDHLEIIGENDVNKSKPVSENVSDWLLKEINQLPQKVVMIAFTYDNDKIHYKDYCSIAASINQLNNRTDKSIIYSENLKE